MSKIKNETWRLRGADLEMQATGVPTPPETADLKRLAELEELGAEADYTIWKLAGEIDLTSACRGCNGHER